MPKEYAEAKREAKRVGISLAAYFRSALQKMLPKNTQKPWMHYAGMVTSGNPNSSQEIDDIIYGQKD